MADACDGAEPPLAEVLADARTLKPIVPSHLPAPGRACVSSKWPGTLRRGAGRDNHLQTQKGPWKKKKVDIQSNHKHHCKLYTAKR